MKTGAMVYSLCRIENGIGRVTGQSETAGYVWVLFPRWDEPILWYAGDLRPARKGSTRSDMASIYGGCVR